MNGFRRLASTFFVLVVVLAGSLGSLGLQAASAQNIAGATVNVRSPWYFEDTFSEVGADYEVMGISNDVGDLLLVGFLPSNIDLNGARDLFLVAYLSGAQNFVELDHGAYGNVSYSLSMVNLQGVEYGVFTVVLGQQVSGFVEAYFLVAPALWFGSSVEEAKASVSVNGRNILTGVGGAGLQGFLDRNAGITGGTWLPIEITDVASTPNEEPAQSGSGNRGDRGGARNESETGRRGSGGSDLAEFEELGLLDQGEYVSPQFDTEVLWDDTWVFDASLDEPIGSDRRAGSDFITLIWSGEDFGFLMVEIIDPEGATPADYVDHWVSDEYLAANADPNAEILLEDSTRTAGAVMTRDYFEDGAEILMVQQAISLDRGQTMALVTLIGFPESFGDAYFDASEDITVGGKAAFDVLTPRQVDRAQ